jgi:hypothetical protein
LYAIWFLGQGQEVCVESSVFMHLARPTYGTKMCHEGNISFACDISAVFLGARLVPERTSSDDILHKLWTDGRQKKEISHIH